MSPDDARRLRELLEGKSRADGFSTRDAEYDPLARDPSAAALDGFAAARLRGRGGAARLAYDLLRWMVVCVHPPNAQLKLGLVQRWELAAALIAAGAEGEATPPASPTAAMEDDAPSAAAAPPVALALVVELLGHANGETVMHVEPAALLLARAAAAPPARHAGARRSAEAVSARCARPSTAASAASRRPTRSAMPSAAPCATRASCGWCRRSIPCASSR